MQSRYSPAAMYVQQFSLFNSQFAVFLFTVA